MDPGRRRRPSSTPRWAWRNRRPDVRKSRFRPDAARATRTGWCSAGRPFFSAHHNIEGSPMEAERSNAIRSQLEDLTTRVVELRRYL